MIAVRPVRHTAAGHKRRAHRQGLGPGE